jgi:hypothetical protein
MHQKYIKKNCVYLETFIFSDRHEVLIFILQVDMPLPQKTTVGGDKELSESAVQKDVLIAANDLWHMNEQLCACAMQAYISASWDRTTIG